MQLLSNKKVPYLSFISLEKLGFIKHGFSTRLGGVSTDHLSSLNLGFEKGDYPDRVLENYRRIGAALDICPDQMVMSVLVHGTTVRRAYKKDAGKGITRPTDFEGCDGLVTNEPGLCLVSRYADCTPLFFVDPVHKAIGLSHSGWRGTAGRMALKTVETMVREFGTKPADIIACIGPSICGDCFEVGPEVAEIFEREFPDVSDKIIKSGEGDRLLIDLWTCNKIAMIEAGISEENIELSGLCTCCNKDLLFSHRGSKGKRGDLAGFLMIKED